MKYNNIEKMLSDLTLQYMMDGYVINTKSMSGHQGEEGKVDLVKGEDLIRIWISRESCFCYDKGKWHGDKMALRVGRWIYPASKSISRWNTVWMKDMDILSEQIFYEISSDWFILDEQEAISIQSMRWSRYKSYNDYGFEEYHDEAHKEIGAKYLKNHLGYKRVSRDKIRVEKRYSHDRNHAAYNIIYNGYAYLLQ